MFTVHPIGWKASVAHTCRIISTSTSDYRDQNYKTKDTPFISEAKCILFIKLVYILLHVRKSRCLRFPEEVLMIVLYSENEIICAQVSKHQSAPTWLDINSKHCFFAKRYQGKILTRKFEVMGETEVYASDSNSFILMNWTIYFWNTIIFI